MKPVLYFDISSEAGGGSLYQLADGSFLWQHSTYNEDLDETKVFQTPFALFDAFWQMLTRDPQWYYQHPLYVHPQIRAFVGTQLKKADWAVQGDARWQQSHQRQWTKVLSDRPEYYDVPEAPKKGGEN
jgi:predicted glycoside hydrolase/deacetylase ChbG (UPF0249 family)